MDRIFTCSLLYASSLNLSAVLNIRFRNQAENVIEDVPDELWRSFVQPFFMATGAFGIRAFQRVVRVMFLEVLMHPDLMDAGAETGYSFSVIDYNAEKIHRITIHADDELNEAWIEANNLDIKIRETEKGESHISTILRRDLSPKLKSVSSIESDTAKTHPEGTEESLEWSSLQQDIANSMKTNGDAQSVSDGVDKTRSNGGHVHSRQTLQPPKHILQQPPIKRESWKTRKDLVQQKFTVKTNREFFMLPKSNEMNVRWVALSHAGTDIGCRITMLRLAVKYKLHPLAVEDALSLHSEPVVGRVTKYSHRIYDIGESMQAEVRQRRFGSTSSPQDRTDLMSTSSQPLKSSMEEQFPEQQSHCEPWPAANFTNGPDHRCSLGL